MISCKYEQLNSKTGIPGHFRHSNINTTFGLLLYLVKDGF